MTVCFGSDHAGFELKKQMIEFAEQLGYETLDVGAFDSNPSDYPVFSELVVQAVLSGEADKGILICGSGIGASVAANKFEGAFAGNCTEPYSARQGVEHDQMNILVMGARVVGVEVAKDMVRAFLNAEFSGIDRHAKRVAMVREIEAKNFKTNPT